MASFKNKIVTVKRAVPRVKYFLRGLLSKKGRKVDFIIGGVQKGGTTALDWYLRHHPSICMASQKEVHFFDNEFIQAMPCSIRNTFYHSFFANCDKERVLGEATPIYMWWPNALRRIKEYNPEIKLIFVLRDPVARAYSHWNMERQRGFEKETFSDCIRRQNNLTDGSRITSYVSRGFYSKQIENARALFDEDQFLFLKNEDLLSNPCSNLAVVTEFLGLPTLTDVQKTKIHARNYDAPINKEDETFLRELFLADIEKLECQLGWELAEWKSDEKR